MLNSGIVPTIDGLILIGKYVIIIQVKFNKTNDSSDTNHNVSFKRLSGKVKNRSGRRSVAFKWYWQILALKVDLWVWI